MDQILVDTCKNIEAYITRNKSDGCGSWEYEHTPYLTSVLSKLNEAQSRYFSIEIFNWSEFHLNELADPIIFCSNEYFNADFLYIKIFVNIKNLEYLDYLVENVIHSIRPPYYTHERMANLKTLEISKLVENVKMVKNIKGKGWESLNEVIEFLKMELIRRE